VGAGACGVLGARSWVASTGGTIREPYAAAAAGRLGSTHTQAGSLHKSEWEMSSPGLVPLASRPAHDTSPGTHEAYPH
jgi:hypothetical protein